jgi:hypothetical protein
LQLRARWAEVGRFEQSWAAAASGIRRIDPTTIERTCFITGRLSRLTPRDPRLFEAGPALATVFARVPSHSAKGQRTIVAYLKCGSIRESIR